MIAGLPYRAAHLLASYALLVIASGLAVGLEVERQLRRARGSQR